MSRKVPKEISEKANPKIYHLLLEVEAFEQELLKEGKVEMAQKMIELRIRVEDWALDKLQAIAYLKRERDNLRREAT
jgi:hypothetical protein